MPTAPLHPCPCSPTCQELLPKGVSRCRPGAVRQERQRYNRETRKWYYTARWAALRTEVLSANPLCDECQGADHMTVATDVDHIVPHRGDPVKFWDKTNLQGLCHTHHSAKTARGQ